MADLTYISSIIKSTVTCPEILAHYGVGICNGRCRCVFHDGEDFNMGIKPDFVNCFVCGKGGDVIDLTAALAGCSKIEAMKILDEFKGLGLFRELSSQEVRERDKQAAELKARRDEATRRREYGDYAWNRLCEYKKQLQWWKQIFAPKSSNEVLLEKYMESIKSLPHINYLLDEYFGKTEQLADDMPDVDGWIGRGSLLKSASCKEILKAIREGWVYGKH